MVSETNDVQAFMVQHPPFDQLSQTQLEYVSSNIFIAFSKSGSEIIIDNSPDSAHKVGMIVVRSGSLEIRTGQGELVDRLSSGDYLLTDVINNQSEHPSRVFVLEDCLYYEITDYALWSLGTSSSEIASVLESDSKKNRTFTEG